MQYFIYYSIVYKSWLFHENELIKTLKLMKITFYYQK